MDYLQYLNNMVALGLTKAEAVLNLVINGLPSIRWIWEYTRLYN